MSSERKRSQRQDSWIQQKSRRLRNAPTSTLDLDWCVNSKLPPRITPPAQQPPFFDTDISDTYKSQEKISIAQNPAFIPRSVAQPPRSPGAGQRSYGDSCGEHFHAPVVGGFGSSFGDPGAKGNSEQQITPPEVRSITPCFGDLECDSATQSSCCSSCPDGLACDAPDCAETRIEVIPCAEEACKQPICPGVCPVLGVQNLPDIEAQNAILAARRTCLWVDTGAFWSPEDSQGSMQNQLPENGASNARPSVSGGPYRSVYDPPVGFDTSLRTLSYLPHGMTQNLHLDVDPAGVHFKKKRASQLQSQKALNAVPQVSNHQDVPSQQPGILNDYSLFNCPWDGCAEPFLNRQDWFPHLHRSHIDPQMTFGCPLQSDACPSAMESDPLTHLELDHGFNFNSSSEGFPCPAPACAPGELYCNPAMLHIHFDQAHATPAQGALRCQLDTCNTTFEVPKELFAHINEYHGLPDPAGSGDDGDLHEHKHGAELVKRFPEDSPKNYVCKWQTPSGHHCNAILESEIALHEHVLHEHVAPLHKSTGYLCQWESCQRLEKPIHMRGFAQRGKLERHMASHTGFKCCSCDVCGERFSAPQALAQHKLLHTGEKPWACKYCPKTFPQQSACTIHMRTHTNEKPLICPVCGKGFSESSNLGKHRKTHGEKGTHACEFPGCDRSFYRLDQLKRHRRVHEKKAEKMQKGEKMKRAGGTISPKE